MRAAREVDFRPGLLGAALALALVDLVIAYALRGLLPRFGAARRGGGVPLLLLALSRTRPARARRDDDFAIKATSEFHLAYVRTGIPDVDDEVRAGLAGLSDVLNRRTAVDAAEPMEVDIEHDELIFFPLLYWPVVPRRGAAFAAGGRAAQPLPRHRRHDPVRHARPGREHAALRRRRRKRMLRQLARRARTSRRWCRCRPTTC